MNDTISLAAPAATVAPALKPRTDHHIWGTYIFLVIVSVIELFSASIQEINAGNIYAPIIRHSGFIVIGLLIMLGLQKVHYRYIYFFIPLFVVASMAAMLYVNFAGTRINGTMRAITIGPVNVLPAEFLKLAVALGVAWILSHGQLKDRRDVSRGWFIACVVFIWVCCLLLFFHGLTNTILVAAIGFSMMLIGGVGFRKWLLAVFVTMLIAGAGIGAKTMFKSGEGPTEEQKTEARLNHEEIGESTGIGRGSTWRGRVERFLGGEKYKEPLNDLNKQEQLSYIAQARGGIIGKGIAHSRENARLPLAFSDYIFAIVVEELGLLVGLFLILCYMWILGRAAALTMSFKQTLPAVMVLGCACVIVFQALIHIAIVTGFFPVSGQPLPLISKGGTSIIATSMAIGIMLSVSRHAARVRDSGDTASDELEILPENIRSENPAMLVREEKKD